ncbi:glycoside hydrolase family 13 protein [Angelakisella massiliensis]|uniref:glycoside hydrolase family 13 protein n=1 Tax=Angelakisella massiliensis TaxID=1871018 RepID=UPI0008F9589E|nr:alpha-glucosidase [Angelakisella massiliensis]
MKEAWWKEAVVYQIYPRSFMDTNGDGVGDLRGILEKLDYLVELGVDVVWLCPIYPSPNDDNGYDISDYQGIMAEFGTMEDFDLLLSEMHRRGLKLMMDLVVNHTSDEHPWFQAALRDPKGPYRDYYFFRDGREDDPPNNWGSFFGFSAWEREPGGEQYYLHLFTKKQPDLNWENPAVREEVCRLAEFWAKKGIDGFRMDVINLISKTPGLPDLPGLKEGEIKVPHLYCANGPQVHEYLRELNRRVLTPYSLMTVGEMIAVDPQKARLYTHEDREELNMVFTFEHMDLDAVGGDKWKLRPWRLDEMKEVFGRWQRELAEGCWNSLYLNNHDQPRMVSRYGDDGPYRVESAKMLATFLHTLQGTPYIYQGEELGMTNIRLEHIEDYRDVEILNHYKEAVEVFGQNPNEVMEAIYTKGRDNARTPMQWSDQPNAGFTTGTPWLAVNPNYTVINAEAARKDPDSIFHYYRRLLALRKQYKVMVYGDYSPVCEEHPAVWAYLRRYQEEALAIVLNFFGTPAEIQLPEGTIPQESTVLISNYKDFPSPSDHLSLRPYEAVVYHFHL